MRPCPAVRPRFPGRSTAGARAGQAGAPVSRPFVLPSDHGKTGGDRWDSSRRVPRPALVFPVRDHAVTSRETGPLRALRTMPISVP